MGQEMGTMGLLVWLLFVVLMVVSMWKVYVKAGQPGWAVIVPFYNLWVLLKIAGKPGWWLLLFFIPLVNIVVIFMVAIAIARNFGKGVGFGIGLVFLGFIFYPILAFTDATYTAPAA
jgi:hypothetical protein